MDNVKKIVLVYPIIIDSDGIKKEISEISMRRLKTKDLEKVPPALLSGDKANLSVKDLIPVIALMAGLDIQTIGEVDLSDLTKIAEAVKDFL